MEWRSGWRAELVYRNDDNCQCTVRGVLEEVSKAGGNIQKFRLITEDKTEYLVNVTESQTQFDTWDTTNEVHLVENVGQQLIGEAISYRPLGPSE